ncbi:MAG: NAD(P)/FAD-dependent oxidoreductase [bacterium]
MEYDFDAVIVGGGPAGATFALYAEGLGLRVLLLDKKKFPRDKVCGDAISGKSVTYLRELGLIEKLEKQPQVRANGVTFSSPDGTVATIPFTPPNAEQNSFGYVCRREVFDNVLFQAAKCRVETFEEFNVENVMMNNGQVCGVVGNNCATQARKITAKVVVGADGFHSIVSRKLGFYQHDPKHWVVATRAYYSGVTEVTDAIEIHFVKDILPGYFWIFPLENGLVNVGIGMLHSELKRRGISLRKAHVAATESNFFRKRFRDAKLVGNITGWNLPVGSKRRKVHGNGFLLLGDAAGLIDPFSGEGIGNAMCSGKIAAELLAEVCKSEDFSSHILRKYEQRLWERLGEELQISHTLQKIGRFRPLLNLIVSRAARRKDVRDWISMMMAGIAPKNTLKSPFTYFRMLLK